MVTVAHSTQEITQLFLERGKQVQVGEWQSIRGDIPQADTIEIEDITFVMPVPTDSADLQEAIQANQPWAEDHFMERVSGTPWNPPPSHEYWPYAQANNAQHRKDEKFSHTYPERFWCKYLHNTPYPRHGIRFLYGDFADLIELLRDRPHTRQAFLPIWHPEDLTAAARGERVPCTLGYHFLLRGSLLKCVYYIRSCDFMRHFRDDVYLAARLTQYVAESLTQEWAEQNSEQFARSGRLVMHISSLHIFSAEFSQLEQQAKNEMTTQLLKGLG